MEKDQLSRKLAVILHADIVGSTVLVQRDERRAHERITNAFQRFSQTIREYGGLVHEIRGDALLAEFTRASDAACATLAFQQENTVYNKTLDDDIVPEIRVGVALGEVVIADKTVTGAGVVLAQRIEQLCEPSGVNITEAIREALPDRLPIDSENLGKHDLKGFEKTVRVYSVRLQADTEVPPPEPQQIVKQNRKPLVALAIAILVSITVALVWLKPWQPDTALASIERMAFPLPEKPSIVVLPFSNLSDDPEQEVFVDGLTGDIISDLTRYRSFFIIARQSSFAYKNKAVTAQQVAEELGVQYLVEGSIERTSNQFRISAQLIDALTGRLVWADRYEVPLDSAIAARDEVVNAIVSSFPGKIERAESAKAARRGIDTLSAHELVYRGWYHWRKFTQADNTESGRLFAKAAELDHGFAGAFHGLTWFHAHEFEHRWGEDPEASLDLALTNARKALSIAPDDYNSHWAVGVVHLYRKEFDQAVAAHARALELNPNNASLLVGNSELLIYVGKASAAIEDVKRAMRLNPFHPKWYEAFLAAAYFDDRQYENAVKTGESLIGMGMPNTNNRLAASYAYLGDMDKAKAHAAKVLELEPGFSIQQFAKSRSYKEISDLEHYLEGLRKAGLPE
jgi:adenylate cyclase